MSISNQWLHWLSFVNRLAIFDISYCLKVIKLYIYQECDQYQSQIWMVQFKNSFLNQQRITIVVKYNWSVAYSVSSFFRVSRRFTIFQSRYFMIYLLTILILQINQNIHTSFVCLTIYFSPCRMLMTQLECKSAYHAIHSP